MSTPIHRQPIQSPLLYDLPPNIYPLHNSQHHDHALLDVPRVDPALTVIDLPAGDMTNVQSPPSSSKIHKKIPSLLTTSILLQRIFHLQACFTSAKQSHVHHPTLSLSTTSRRTTSCTRSSTTTRPNPSTSYSSTCIVGIPPTTAFSQHQPSFTLLPLRPIDHQQVAILGTMEGLFQFLKPTQSIQMD